MMDVVDVVVDVVVEVVGGEVVGEIVGYDRGFVVVDGWVYQSSFILFINIFLYFKLVI